MTGVGGCWGGEVETLIFAFRRRAAPFNPKGNPPKTPVTVGFPNAQRKHRRWMGHRAQTSAANSTLVRIGGSGCHQLASPPLATTVAHNAPDVNQSGGGG